MSQEQFPHFEALLKARRSVRGFTKEPVAPELLRKVFSQAQYTPSNCNTQPWHVHVVSGSVTEVLRQRISEAMMAGEMSMDFPYDGKYEGAYRERQYDAAHQLYTAMDIAREDKEKRNNAFFRNFEFFGAPHVAFLFIDENFGIREAADIGMYSQSLMLAITANGLASCPQTALGFHADLVRDVLGIDASKKLLFGISFGYEDPDVPANKARIGKAALEETVTFHD